VAEIIMGAPTLTAAGQQLIAAANEAGGRDNITVVLFALEEIPDLAAAAKETGNQETMVGAAAPTAAEVREAVAAQQAPAPEGSPAPPAEPLQRVRRPRAPRAPVRRQRGDRRRWPLVGGVVTLVVIGVVAAGAWVASQTVYFIGTNQSGFITVFQGLPYDLPAGVRLYSTNYVSGVNAQGVSPDLRGPLLDHSLRSHRDASDLIRRLELGQLSIR
jgi:protein phosphatase